MNHWLVVPIVLPAVLAPFMLLFCRYHIDLQKRRNASPGLNELTYSALVTPWVVFRK